METKANYVIVGLFTLLVVAAGFVFVGWFSRPVSLTEGNAFEVAYEGSVSGLRPGSAVLFNGVRVGEVKGLRLDPADPRRVIATLAVQSATPLRADTKAGLEFQGITGVAAVSLTGGQPDAPPPARGPGGVPQLIAESASTQDTMTAVRRAASRAEEMLARLDALIADNQADVRAAVAGITRFSEALGRNSDEVDSFIKNASSAARSLNKLLDSEDGKGVAAEIAAAARSIRELAERLDKRTADITVGINRFTSQGLREFETLAADGRRTLNDFDRALRKFERNPSQFIFGGGGVPDYSSRR